MTIIKPNKQKKESLWTWIISSVGIMLVLSVIACGCVYSKIVGIEHEIAALEENISLGKTKNAELKTAVFRMTDPQILEAIAEEKGLIEDKNPQWVFASL
jgi:cell division protein FtsL